MWFGEPNPFPRRGSPTRLSASGQQSYEGWSCRIWTVFYVSCETEYWRVTMNCCFMGDIKFTASYRSPTQAELMHRNRYQQRSELAYCPNECTEIMADIKHTEVQEYSSAVNRYCRSDQSGQRAKVLIFLDKDKHCSTTWKLHFI